MVLSKHHTNEHIVIIASENGHRFQYEKPFTNLLNADVFQQKVRKHLDNGGKLDFSHWDELIPNIKAEILV